jgi:hypothetical protein
MSKRANAPAMDRGGAADGAGSDSSPSQSIRRTATLDTRNGEVTIAVAPTRRPRGGTIPRPDTITKRSGVPR